MLSTLMGEVLKFVPSSVPTVVQMYDFAVDINASRSSLSWLCSRFLLTVTFVLAMLLTLWLTFVGVNRKQKQLERNK